MYLLDFFAPAGTFPPTGVFSAAHIIYTVISFVAVGFAIHFTKKKPHETIKKIIRNLVLILWVLEIAKIIFNLVTGDVKDFNSYIPLYFCSITLYAGLLAAFGKGILKKTGEVFLATGGLIGGFSYLILPLTSVSIYPFFHFITIHSFVYHSIMLYIGLLILTSGYRKLKAIDIDHHFLIVAFFSAIAYIFNCITGSNLMFLSQNYPGTPIEILYNHLQGFWFPIVMFCIHAFIPFYAAYFVYKLFIERKSESK